jgi:co-chaperonin GroES (HSP10)
MNMPKEKYRKWVMKPTRNVISFIFKKQDKVSSGGILLQENAKKASTFGIVQAVGPEVKEVAVGDTIFCDWAKAHAVANDLLAIEEDYVHLILSDA